MIPRKYLPRIKEQLRRYPAVAILGPRQSGKTTLAKTLGGSYFDLEEEGSAVRLDAEWNERVEGDALVIIDEAQEAPEIFKRLRGTIDKDRKRNGRFLLLGSVSPAIMHSVSESLAGRIGFQEISPLTIEEVGIERMDTHWLRGGFPDGGILDSGEYPDWQRNYLEALIYRDFPTWGLTASAQTSKRLLQMLASLHGQPQNASQIGQALGHDHKTVQRYIDFMEGAYLIRSLQPYYANIRKRLVKRPRIYLRDTGLLHALMRVADHEALYGQPWLGQSWEGYLIEQTLSALSLRGKYPAPFYFRSSDGYEIDLVLDWGTETWAIEMKLSSNPAKNDVNRLNKAADMIGAKRRILICRTAEPFDADPLCITNPHGWFNSIAGVEQ